MTKYTIRYTHADGTIKQTILIYADRDKAERDMIKSAHYDQRYPRKDITIDHIVEIDTGEILMYTIPPKSNT